MEFGLFDGGRDSEKNGVRFAEISKIFMTQDEFSIGMITFDGALSESIRGLISGSFDNKSYIVVTSRHC